MADEQFPNGYPARIARLEEWRRATEDRLRTMPTEAQLVRLDTRMGAMNRELTRQGDAFDQFVTEWKKDQDDERDRRSSRNTAMWGWIISIICAVLGAATLIVVSLGHLG